MVGHKSNRLAENLGVKNAKWDKEDGYFVPRECYNSYFYLVEAETCNLADKFILHGKKLTKYLDGGQPNKAAVYAWATKRNPVNRANGCGMNATYC